MGEILEFKRRLAEDTDFADSIAEADSADDIIEIASVNGIELEPTDLEGELGEELLYYAAGGMNDEGNPEYLSGTLRDDDSW